MNIKFFIFAFLSVMTLLGKENTTLFLQQTQHKLLDKLHHTTPIILRNTMTLTLTKGWNFIESPRKGVDVMQLLKQYNTIVMVAIYDEKSSSWATAPQRIDGVLLRDIEPKKKFFIFTTIKQKITLPSIVLHSSICNALLHTQGYNILEDNGDDTNSTANIQKRISLQSRYLNHHQKNLYCDSRVLLIYPESTIQGEKMVAYGPAIPKIALTFDRGYEGKNFFVYDYATQGCYRGIFPSRRVPPFPFLEKLK